MFMIEYYILFILEASRETDRKRGKPAASGSDPTAERDGNERPA